ncbi:MAG: hypothetical protein R2880_03050 [Deinococcales bacterium]
MFLLKLCDMMGTMIYDHGYLDMATPAQMDALWAEGWRHFGRMFFRYETSLHENNFYTVWPIRLCPKDFKPSRSHKRTLKKNSDIKVNIMPAFIDEAALTLFDIHKQRFSNNVPQSIYDFLSPAPAFMPCSCMRLELYLVNKLIGLSFLDIGERATSSVYQCFDPEYEDRALGILMILLSIDYSHQQGKDWYYPGYVYKEASFYDYKKQFRPWFYYDWQGHWLDEPNETASQPIQAYDYLVSLLDQADLQEHDKTSGEIH